MVKSPNNRSGRCHFLLYLFIQPSKHLFVVDAGIEFLCVEGDKLATVLQHKDPSDQTSRQEIDH